MREYTFKYAFVIYERSFYNEEKNEDGICYFINFYNGDGWADE